MASKVTKGDIVTLGSSDAARLDLESVARSLRESRKRSHEATTCIYQIARFSVSLHFSNQVLSRQILPALQHLVSYEQGVSMFEVFLCDHGAVPGLARALLPLYQSMGATEVWIRDTSETTLILQEQGRVLSLIDWTDGRGYWCVSNAASVSYLERAAPLRAMLGLWLGKHGCYLVHAAAVGEGDLGVLILGRGGSGKSTTALNCFHSGMNYVGDDYCLVSDREPMRIHSLYGTGKLGGQGLNWFDSLAAVGDMEGRPQGEKLVLFLSRLTDRKLSRDLALRAILLVRVGREEVTRLFPVPASHAFLALAASGGLHFPPVRLHALRCFNLLVRRLPVYMLELGSDIDAIPGVVRSLLRTLEENP